MVVLDQVAYEIETRDVNSWKI